MNKTPLPAVGEVITFPYPFVRETFHRTDMDEDGISNTEEPTWKPGTRSDACGDDVENVADGMGSCVITVADVHKPGRYPTRVFFTRTWISPEGKPFGKKKLRITTAATFRVWASGYRIPFEMAKPAAVKP